MQRYQLLFKNPYLIFFCSLDEETRLRQSLHDQLAVSINANATSKRELDELRQALKTSEDKGITWQAELSKALGFNSVLQAEVESSASRIIELESEMRNLRSAVAEKIPLADRVLQLEKDNNATEMALQEAKNVHLEILAQVDSLKAEKAALFESFETFQAEAEERFNRTFKTKEEYILQVQTAESELEQTKQQLLQLQFTCNNLSSRIEEAKRLEPQQAMALKELNQQLKTATAVAASFFDESCAKCFASVNHKLDSYSKRITNCRVNVSTGAKLFSFARASAASTQSNHEKALSSLSSKLNDALMAISSFPVQNKIKFLCFGIKSRHWSLIWQRAKTKSKNICLFPKMNELGSSGIVFACS